MRPVRGRPHDLSGAPPAVPGNDSYNARDRTLCAIHFKGNPLSTWQMPERVVSSCRHGTTTRVPAGRPARKSRGRVIWRRGSVRFFRPARWGNSWRSFQPRADDQRSNHCRVSRVVPALQLRTRVMGSVTGTIPATRIDSLIREATWFPASSHQTGRSSRRLASALSDPAILSTISPTS